MERSESLIQHFNRIYRALTWSIQSLMLLPVASAFACSTIVLGSPDRPLIAYSFDFAATGSGHLYVNPLGIKRRSVLDHNPAQWLARFGSVTFNQLGPGMPTTGMNTAGLVVSLMWNKDAAYSTSGTVPTVTELEFIQWLLDRSGTVKQALNSLNEVQIVGTVPIHYLIADRFGNTAAITPTLSGIQVHTAGEMPIPALTNTSYADLMQSREIIEHIEKRKIRTFRAEDNNLNSLDRFALAAIAIGSANAVLNAEDAFEVLDSVANQETQWQVIFEPAELEISFQISGFDDVHFIDLANMDLRCQKLPLAADLQSLSKQTFPAVLNPMKIADVEKVARKVLGSFTKNPRISKEMAVGLVSGLLNLSSCVQ